MFSSKGSPEDPPNGCPNVNPAICTGGVSLETPTTADPVVPRYSNLMKEAYNVATAKPRQAHGVEKSLNSVEEVQNVATLSDGQQAVINTLAASPKALMDVPRIADDIEKGVDTFMEAAPIVIKALDAAAELHPFIAVAVTAFKAVYMLEVTRRNNDRRIVALQAEMLATMKILVQVDDVSDPKKVAPDGRTIEGRMRELCDGIAEDIKRCGNVCDTYRKKRLLVKVFNGPKWELQLVEFVEVFANRRRELVLALTIHTAVAVDEVNVKLTTNDQRTAELIQRMEEMKEMFREKFVTLEQRQLLALVVQKGGLDAVICNEQAMEELVTKETSISAPVGGERHRSAKKFDLEEIQREIQGDPTEAIERNEESFLGKFNLQTRQIRDLERAVKQQGDRIFSALTGGPHKRIRDLDLRQIWKEMGWRGSVKARHFVLALKDHYAETAVGSGDGATSPDEWALRYINVNRARNIMEAFDEDASGFITIKEANDFTCSRPQDWSLPHWLAYWAIGWQTTCTSYCKKIEEIFDAMIRLSDEVLPENRKEVNEYICYVWTQVTTFTRSIKWDDGTEELRVKFQSHVDREEKRLQENLEDIKYDIDSYDSVHLISGRGRIETTLFPMLYLLLQRDLQKISLARKHVLSDSELPDALDTIQWIITAAWYRVRDLEAIFEQQGLSPKDQFVIHAKSLYRIISEGDGFNGDKLRELPDHISENSDIIPNQDLDPSGVLNHPIGNKHEADFAAYDVPTRSVSSFIDGPDAVLGTYHGFIYHCGKPLGPMRDWTLNRGSEENSIVASGTHYQSGYHNVYTLTGTTGPLEGERVPVELKIGYSAGWQEITMTGHFDPEENSLRGTVTWEYGLLGEFVFKRDPDFVRFYPAPSTIDARGRWKYAKMVIFDRIRRQLWSSSYILGRIKGGKRYMELAVRDHYYGKDLDDDESDEYNKLLSSLCVADVRFYASRIKIKLSEVTIHYIQCDSCRVALEGARVLCMDCHFNYSLNLCSESECLDSEVTLSDRPGLEAQPPHTPNHDMLKVHRILFGRDVASTERSAKDALKAAWSTISDLEAEKKLMPECICCQNVVSLPCWYCVDCTEKFICSGCEHKGRAFKDAHTKRHTLVRVIQKVDETKVSTEERLKAVEEQLGSVKEHLEQLGTFQDEMRRLFLKLFEKGTEGFPDDPPTKGDIPGAATAEPSLGGLLSKGEGDGGGDECA